MKTLSSLTLDGQKAHYISSAPRRIYFGKQVREDYIATFNINGKAKDISVSYQCSPKHAENSAWSIAESLYAYALEALLFIGIRKAS